MGQSNMSGRGQGYDEKIDGPNNPRVQQWSRDNQTIPASEHLEHHDFSIVSKTSVGMGTAFGHAYVETLPAQRNVLLVPTAHGGTSLVHGPWSPGGHLFEEAVTRLEAALASDEDGGNCVAGVLWHQGEADAGRHVDQETYQLTWMNMVDVLRTRVPAAAQAPVVLGEFSPLWIEYNEKKVAPILAAIRAIPGSVPFTAVAPSDGLSSNSSGPKAAVHFDAVAQREYGQRYFDKLDQAIGNNRVVVK